MEGEENALKEHSGFAEGIELPASLWEVFSGLTLIDCTTPNSYYLSGSKRLKSLKI